MTREARTKIKFWSPVRNPLMKLFYWILYAAFSNLWNRDDPVPSPWYEPEWPEWMRWTGWWLRNPNQDFRAYVIGIVEKEFELIQWNNHKGNFKPGGWKGHHLKYKGLRYPYISFQSKPKADSRVLQFYVGWMEVGRFGYKLRKHNPKTER